MDYQNKLFRKLGKKYGVDWRVVKEAVYSPLKFTNRVVQHPTDERPVRIMYFGAFTQKQGKNNKQGRMTGLVETLLENIDEVTVVMGSVLEFPIKSTEGAKKIINNAKDTNDYDKVKMIWDAWQEYKK